MDQNSRSTSNKQENDENSFDQTYWDQRYQNSEIGWDLKQVSPPLKHYIEQCTNKNLKILIPGAGNAYEANYLLEQDFNDITIVDIAPTVVDRLQKQFQNNSRIQIILIDFFNLSGKYDLILEQTFFCALSPFLRSQYVAKMYDLLHTDGKLVGLLFDKKFEGGPPFGGNKAEYEILFQSHFNFHTFQPCYNSIGPRMNAELFFIFSKKENATAGA